ncbi:MAG: hypothetical protein KY428_11685 [Bacteroidetes bacterium]|nr:hypothetical protein [Bacteroidota bacterium]
MKTEENKTPAQIEKECLAEIAEVLEKHNCLIDVTFSQDSVFQTKVLKYQPIVIYKGEQK